MGPIIRVARANLGRIKTLDIFWSEYHVPNDGPLYPLSLDRLTKDLPTGHYRYEERRTFYDGRVDENPIIEAFDGNVRTAYPWRDYQGPSACLFAGYIKKISASCLDSQRHLNGATDTCRTYAPVDFPFPLRFLEYLGECRARPGQEEIEGRSCVVADHFVHGKLEGRIWLDVERGAMPVREVAYHETPATFYYGPSFPEPGMDSVSEVTEARRFTANEGPCVWLPTKMKESDAYGTSEEQVDIVRTRVNPEIDPRQFRVTFPKGTPVFNPATGYFFVTDPNDPSTGEPLSASPATRPVAPAK
jgi:hypothetical protein